MNKKIILSICITIVIVIIIAVILTALIKNDNNINNNQTGKETSFYVGGNVASEGLESINKHIILGDILQNVKEENINQLLGIDDSKANELIDLEGYKGLEKKVAKYEDNNEYTEIWLLKISERSQPIKIFRKFNERIESLRYEYKNNSRISKILNNEDNIIMKQQNGIVIIIISNEAKEIEKSIDAIFIK